MSFIRALIQITLHFAAAFCVWVLTCTLLGTLESKQGDDNGKDQYTTT